MQRALALSPALVLLSACLDSAWWVEGLGERGRVVYRLQTDQSQGGIPLQEVQVVAGWEQRVQADLSARGALGTWYTGTFTHTIVAGDAEVTEQEYCDQPVIDLLVTAPQPGAITLVTLRDGEEYDRIELQFELVSLLSCGVQMQLPGEGGMTPMDPVPERVPLGTHVVLEPVSYGADREQLAGLTDISFRAAIQDWQTPWSWFTPGMILNMTSPGPAWVELRDNPSGATCRASWEVEAD